MEELSRKELDKIAEAAVISEKLKEQQRVLSKQERQKTAEEIKQNLPAPPKNIIFKMIRGSLERKIERIGKTADKCKNELSVLREKYKKAQSKIDKAAVKIHRCEKANEFLKGLKFGGALRDMLIKSNDKKITAATGQIVKYTAQQEQTEAKAFAQKSKLREQESTLDKLTEKVQKIDELKNSPHGVLMYYLSELSEAKEAREAAKAEQEHVSDKEADIENEKADIQAEREFTVETDFDTEREFTVNMDEIDMEAGQDAYLPEWDEREFEEREEDYALE